MKAKGTTYSIWQFATRNKRLKREIAEKTGAETSKAKSVLSMLTPLALSMIAKRN